MYTIENILNKVNFYGFFLILTLRCHQLYSNFFKGEPLDVMSEEDAEKKKEFENQLNAFDGDWSTMQSSIRNSHKIEPVLIQCSLDQDEALTQATKKIEGDFCL